MRDHPFNPGGAFDQWVTRTPEEYFGTEDVADETFVLTCLLSETYDKEGRLVNQSTLPLSLYPQLTEKKEDGSYTLTLITFRFADGSELCISRNEP